MAEVKNKLTLTIGPPPNVHMTHCEVMDGSHSQSVTKILTAYWSKKTYFRPGARKTEIHSFPTMYIMGGGSFGGNGSK